MTSTGKRDLAQHRAESAGDVERQMPTRRPVDLLAEHLDQRDVVALRAVGLGDLEQAGGARVLRLVVGVAEAGDEAPLGAVRGDPVGEPRALVAVLGHAVLQDLPAARHGARELVSHHQQPRGDWNLQVGRYRVMDQPGDQRLRGDAVIHQDDHAGIENPALRLGQLAARDDKVERLGEAHLADDLGKHVLAAHPKLRGIRGGAADAGGRAAHSTLSPCCGVRPQS